MDKQSVIAHVVLISLFVYPDNGKLDELARHRVACIVVISLFVYPDNGSLYRQACHQAQSCHFTVCLFGQR